MAFELKFRNRYWILFTSCLLSTFVPKEPLAESFSHHAKRFFFFSELLMCIMNDKWCQEKSHKLAKITQSPCLQLLVAENVFTEMHLFSTRKRVWHESYYFVSIRPESNVTLPGMKTMLPKCTQEYHCIIPPHLVAIFFRHFVSLWTLPSEMIMIRFMHEYNSIANVDRNVFQAKPVLQQRGVPTCLLKDDPIFMPFNEIWSTHSFWG